MNLSALSLAHPIRQTGLWHLRLFFAPLLALVLLAFTYLYWANEERAGLERRRQTFDAAVEQVVSNLSDRMAAYEIVLRGVKGYFDGSDRISQAEFQAYVNALQLPQTRPGLQAVALIHQVPDADIAQHEAQAQSEGLSGYRVHPLQPMALHAPITHIEPQSPENLQILGLDAATRSPLRDGLERARDTDQLVLTGPVEQAPDGSATLAMYLPLYVKGPAPKTVAERRERIDGWVAAPFRLGEVIGGLSRELDADIALAIFDGPSLMGGVQMFASRADPASPQAGGLEALRSLDVGGRRWTLALHPLPSFEGRFERVRHDVIAFLGVVFSLLAGWFLALQATGHQRAKALARHMTRELRSARDELDSTLNAVPDLLFEVGLDGHIYHYRSGRSDVLSAKPGAFIGRFLHEILPAPAVAECMAALKEAQQTGHSFGRQYGLQLRGEQRWFELSIARKEHAATRPGANRVGKSRGEAPVGAPARFIALSRDITSRRQAEDAMHQLAYFDALTGLPNRRRLMDELRQALEAAQQGGFIGGVFYVDLDNFKQINDARGHTIGDSLLVQAAQRLARNAKGGDVVARLGGDEFVMLVPRLGSNLEAGRHAALNLAAQLRDSLDVPYTVAGTLYSSTGSVGVTLFPRGEEGVEDLLREADTAMYCAKGLGRNRVSFFEPGMHADAQERLALEQDLKQAVAEDALQVYIQPQVDAAGGVTGGELLLRWHHARRGNVPPSRFIAVAEDSGLILRMGTKVLYKACEALAMLHAAGQMLHISVNVSQRQFRQDDFVGTVQRALQETGAPASLLILEVTESLLVEDWEDAVRRMTELVRIGVRFSIDDFGTGYSSLAYLKKLPLFELKIDRSFVKDAPTDPNDAAIVQAILSMARHLKLHVTAEGVETEEQAAFLRRNACEGLQGYLFGRPEPLLDWLVRQLR
ncbi:MAG: EAL domain-containing protein [Comamonadaceae bacterium]|nr:MAG: EAL domain-containing protein [Comamonadaceae bacterium]